MLTVADSAIGVDVPPNLAAKSTNNFHHEAHEGHEGTEFILSNFVVFVTFVVNAVNLLAQRNILRAFFLTSAC